VINRLLMIYYGQSVLDLGGYE